MKPQLVLMRILRRPTTPTIQTSCPSPRAAAAAATDRVLHTGTAQWDVNHPFHLAVLESQGILQTYMLETSDGGAKAYLHPCVAFQLHLSFGVNAQESGNKCGDSSRRDWDEEFSNGLKPIKQPWGSFEFIPKRPGEIIFFQAESSRILFAQLPGGSPRYLIYSEGVATQIDQDRTKVYCVGRHSSTILSIAVRSDGLALASAARDGCLRIWRLSDGTMIAQTMFARWRQPRNPGIGRVSPLRRQNDEIDCAYPALRVVSFFGKSWDVAMGCPSGEARTWSVEADEGSPLTIKKIADSATLFSGKSPISSIALHVPDNNFPLQQQQEGEERQAVNFLERVAVGTANGKLQVWTRHKVLGEWAPTWSTTASSEGASIVCLSFRADGGLLAAAASFLAKQLTEEETEALLLASPPKKLKRVCERLYLYETISWACVGSFNFSSQIGCCLFYRPPFKAEDKKDPMSCVSREKVSSCRVLLVSTANGPQAHILPEHGLFGYRYDRVRDRDSRSFQRQQSFSRKESKTVRWADLKRERGGGGAHHSCPSDHVRSPTPGSSTSSDREQLRPVTARDLLWTPNSPMGRSEAKRNAAALKSRCRPPPIRSGSGSRSPAGGCVQSGGGVGGVRRPPVRDPFRDPSLLSLPPESVGLPMEVVMRYRAGLRQWPPQVKSRKCVCCSKHARSKELPIPYPMGQVVIQKLKNVAAKQIPPPKPALRKKATAAPQARKVTSDRSTALASLAIPSPTPSRPLTPQFNKKKPYLIYSKRFDHHPHRRGHGFVSTSETELHDGDCDSLLQQATQTDPRESTLTLEEPPTREGEEVEVEEAESEGEEEEEEEAEGEGQENIAVSCAASHPVVHQEKDQQRVIGGQRFYTAKVQHFKGGKENFHDHLDQHSTDSPRQQQQHIDAATQYSTSGKDSPVQSQQQQQVFTDRNWPQLVGGGNLPDKHIVGGNELEDFLVRSRSPLAVVGSAVREMAKERKLVLPEPFSCTKLMARLREIEQETFSLDAALQVAKLRGIELNKEDEMELRKALEEEENKQTVTTKGPELETPGRPSSVRYTQLKKITDPRVAHPGPFLAPRKVRKQVDPKWEDMRTMKPTMSDLFDLKERYAQVCSPAPADIDHSVMYVGTERDVEDSELWSQREATCRHAWSSQAVYDSCLYRPDQRDPDCGCNFRVHVMRAFLNNGRLGNRMKFKTLIKYRRCKFGRGDSEPSRLSMASADMNAMLRI